jgi:hypothetical protein
MKWRFWDRIKGLPVEALDPDSVAYEGIRLVVLAHNTALDYWRKFASDFSGDILSYIERCIWAYQLQILCDAVARRSDPPLADAVKGNILKYLHVLGSGPGEDLLQAVTTGRALYKPGDGARLAQGPEAECDLVIANTFLYSFDIAEGRKTEILIDFARCLSVARAAGEIEFASFLSGVFICRTSSLSWSRMAGCFERHLQRRFQNLLFDSHRREVETWELSEARQQDLQDAFAFAAEYRGFEAQVRTGGLTTIGKASENLDSCHRLKTRIAQIGGDWRLEKKGLSLVIDETQKLFMSTIKDSRLEANFRKGKGLSAVQEIAFWAQVGRDDSPIHKHEIINALLSEDVETIRTVAMIAAATLWDLRCEAQSILEQAVRDGFPQAVATERLSTLVKAWTEGDRRAKA